jgi:hypothetical protein
MSLVRLAIRSDNYVPYTAKRPEKANCELAKGLYLNQKSMTQRLRRQKQSIVQNLSPPFKKGHKIVGLQALYSQVGIYIWVSRREAPLEP